MPDLPTLLRKCHRQNLVALRQLWRGVKQTASRNKARLIAGALLSAVLAFLLIRSDTANFTWTETHQNPEARSTAQAWSYWGDFPTGTLPLFALVFATGFFVRKKALWRRAAFALLLGSTAGGALANTIRLTSGRPRPSAEFRNSDQIPSPYHGGDPIPYGFYGPHMDARYQGFPSGHTATAFGAASALAVVLPPVGVPCLGAAGMVAWSRIYLGRHYPSDLFVGGLFGCLAGGLVGTAARKRWPKPATKNRAPKQRRR